MSGRRLPGGYNEIGRWTLNQASVKELLLFGLVGLFAFFASLAAAGFVVGTATGSAETTIDGGTFFSGLLLGGVLGVILHEAVHGVFFLAFGAAGRASGSSRGPGLGRSSTQPPPEAISTGLGTSPPGCRRQCY